MQARQQAASACRTPALAPAPVCDGRQQLAVIRHQRQPRALAPLHLRAWLDGSWVHNRPQRARRPRAWQCGTPSRLCRSALPRGKTGGGVGEGGAPAGQWCAAPPAPPRAAASAGRPAGPSPAAGGGTGQEAGSPAQMLQSTGSGRLQCPALAQCARNETTDALRPPQGQPQQLPCLRDDGQHTRRAAAGDQLLHPAPCQHAVRLLNGAGGCEHVVSLAMLRQAPNEQCTPTSKGAGAKQGSTLLCRALQNLHPPLPAPHTPASPAARPQRWAGSSAGRWRPGRRST